MNLPADAAGTLGDMKINSKALSELAHELSERPGHVKVAALLHQALTQGLGARSRDIDFERPLPEVRGRADALLGRTVFEIKADLRRERAAAEGQLARYLAQRQEETEQDWIGIATDGLDYRVYALRDGKLDLATEFTLDPAEPDDWLAWLDGIVLLTDAKDPTPKAVQDELGRTSVAYHRAAEGISQLWEELKDHPEVQLKFDLWRQMLHTAYWFESGDESLFCQHTYLTIVAKGIATLAIREHLQEDPAEVLSGEVFRQSGIVGGVEHDLFSWVLRHPDGSTLVSRILGQLRAFNLRKVKTDILKTLYESLIDPAERHDLGEYYTPDWLAARICAETIDNPLKQRVLDPACGSGTFLYHAMRQVLKAADARGFSADRAIKLACGNIVGLDIHPVAVVLAGTTAILALQHHLPRRRGKAQVHIPVYLGDATQWNVEPFGPTEHVLIRDPKGPDLFFPVQIARNPGLFDAVIDSMQDHLRRDDEPDAFVSWLRRNRRVSAEARPDLNSAYETLLGLSRAGRNDIWPYVAKHLTRPVWLSQPEQRVDRIVGNPPWVAYRYMSRDKKTRFRDRCAGLGIWVGGKVATHQDLSAYFFARAVELYAKPSGRIAMVLPFAAMTREQYATFRTGSFGKDGPRVRFTAAWSFEYDVQPLFEVPSCVLFAKNGGTGPLPAKILAFSGQLPRRDASPEEAAEFLTTTEQTWPGSGVVVASPYKEHFLDGATLYPRRFILVEQVPAGRLGANPAAPVVRGRTSNQDKAPWKNIEPWTASVEAEFLRPVMLGENIAPFRVLGAELGVIPWAKRQRYLVDGATASQRGFPKLATWLKRAEAHWDQHKRSELPFKEQLDYFGKLSAQFPIRPVRVAYSKSGTLPAAALVLDHATVIDHKLYWMKPESMQEARYLIALLNSEALRVRIEAYQSQGQWGARDFDKHIFNAPIPRFDPGQPVHMKLVKAAERAEAVASAVPLEAGTYFITARKRIRAALEANGVAAEIDGLVDDLLRPFEPADLRPKPARKEQIPPVARPSRKAPSSKAR